MNTPVNNSQPNIQHEAICERLAKMDVKKLPRWLKGTATMVAVLHKVPRKEARRMVLDRYPIIGERLRANATGIKPVAVPVKPA